MEKTIGFIVTAGHLDIEWYQPMRSYRFWTVEALEDLKNFAAQRSDFKSYMLDGQFFPLEMYLDVVPEDEVVIRELIASGKLTIGPFYTQFDEWLISGESIVRNCLYGERKCKAFGGYMKAGYLPDNFGHPRQMPQILQSFGIDSLMFQRGLPEIPGGHPDEFMYKGIDGTEVFASHFRDSYLGAFDMFGKEVEPIYPREVPYYADYLSFEHHKALASHDDPERIAKSLINNVHKIKDRFPSGVILLLSCYDHLPPQINIGDSVKYANEMQDEIEFVLGTVEEYVRLVQPRLTDPKIYDVELIGSKYHGILLGAQSTRTYLKRQNFACEILLEKYAEPLDAIASLYGYTDKPALFDEAWRFMMINSAHDSIHGSSVDEVHVEMEARFSAVRQIAAGIIHDAIKHLGKNVKPWYPETEKGILSFSPVKTDFMQPMEVWLPIKDKEIDIIDTQGNVMPTQILKRESIEMNGIGKPRNMLYPDGDLRKVVFLAAPNAFAVERYSSLECKTPGTAISAGDTFIDTELIRVEIKGALINILNKKTGKWNYNLNLLEEDCDCGDAWDYSPSWIPGEIVRSSSCQFTSRLVECGSVYAVIEMNGEINVPHHLVGDNRSSERVSLPITFKITVYNGIARVDVKLIIENNAKDHRIRLCVPTGIKTESVLSGGQFAVLDRLIERPKEIEPWGQPPTQSLPCREWIALNDNASGLAIAFKGIYEYEAKIEPLTGHPNIHLTLLRGFQLMSRYNTMAREVIASPTSNTPGAQCLGVHEIEWSYIPFKTNQTDRTPFLKLAESFLYPPVSHVIRNKLESNDIVSIPSVFDWDVGNVVFSSFKRCLDRDGFILRLFENQGKSASFKLKQHHFNKAFLSDMNEKNICELSISNGEIKLDIEPYKIMTIKLTV